MQWGCFAGTRQLVRLSIFSTYAIIDISDKCALWVLYHLANHMPWPYKTIWLDHNTDTHQFVRLWKVGTYAIITIYWQCVLYHLASHIIHQQWYWVDPAPKQRVDHQLGMMERHKSQVKLLWKKLWKCYWYIRKNMRGKNTWSEFFCSRKCPIKIFQSKLRSWFQSETF